MLMFEKGRRQESWYSNLKTLPCSSVLCRLIDDCLYPNSKRGSLRVTMWFSAQTEYLYIFDRGDKRSETEEIGGRGQVGIVSISILTP